VLFEGGGFLSFSIEQPLLSPHMLSFGCLLFKKDSSTKARGTSRTGLVELGLGNAYIAEGLVLCRKL